MAKAYEGKKAGKSVKKRLKNTKKLLFSRFNVQTFVHRKVWWFKIYFSVAQRSKKTFALKSTASGFLVSKYNLIRTLRFELTCQQAS